jgi:hypothetical protein
MLSNKDKRDRLAAIGVDPYKGIKYLNHDQKSYIARLHRKYSENLDLTDTAVIRTSKKEVIKNARAAGLEVYKGQIMVAKRKAEKVKLTRNGDIQYIWSPRKKEVRILASGEKLLETVERLRKKRFAKNKFITVAIGGNAPFNKMFKNFDDLENYLRSFTPSETRNAIKRIKRDKSLSAAQKKKAIAAEHKKDVERRGELWKHVSIVEIKDDSMVTDYDEDEDE